MSVLSEHVEVHEWFLSAMHVFEDILSQFLQARMRQKVDIKESSSIEGMRIEAFSV